jgi:hypothetical protein
MATQSNQIKIHIDNQEIILTGDELELFEADRAREHQRYLQEIAEAQAKATAKAALLERLGITADEAKLLLA